ncbi:MAG: ABC transporter substrate-binding protein [Deltaproteobacteria bacterium]|nr:ABC transporter substrate-binding protein [Deltaproteobacteria bacterium]MBW1919452.1 ABC transporter substrate-binding protein [Deltaproteobacteria bacterium]MBW2018307.1 ABC transporter substrate-binding protein [Deltaproteobacteria bacterium]
MKRHLIVLATLVLGCLILCSTAFAGARVAGVTDDEVAIGISVPISGPAAVWAAMGLGNVAWAQHINSQGGIHGRKIKVIVKDDGYNPSRALANLTEMKNDVLAYGCVIGSAIANAAKEFLLESHVPVVHIHANPRMWVNVPPEKMKYLFFAYPDYIDEAEAITKFAVQETGIRRIALFYQNDNWEKNAKAGIERAMKKLSGKADFVASVPYEITERALGSHALKLKESGAQGVVIYGTPIHAALILKEMAKVRYRPKIFTANPLGDPLMFKIAGKLWEGAYPAVSGNVAIPGVEQKADRVVEILTKYQPKLKALSFLGLTG